MKKNFLILFLLQSIAISCFAQHETYLDSLTDFRTNYVATHGAVPAKDRDALQFFPVNESYRVQARFERLYGYGWFEMETSGRIKKKHRVYGILHFALHDTTLQLRVYQSEQLLNTKEYKDWLFVPFTDKTSGEETYANGRYIDILIGELESGQYLLDFNKAYNPYCAYVSGVYNCPIPPAENDLPVKIQAGEKNFGKAH